MRQRPTQHGTVLIIVAGISALLLSLALTFMSRMQSDVAESQILIRDAQARIVLLAACHYIQEASRIGYDDSTTEYHKEAYGWIDIRDGTVGPKATATAPFTVTNSSVKYDQTGGLISYGKDDDSAFPQQSWRRFDMYVKEIPPFAINSDPAPNPINPNGGISWLVEPDPKPLTTDFAKFSAGDPTPRQNSVGMSWFRLLRCGEGPNKNLARYNAATFIVTCGAGGTRGFRSWSEMSSKDRELFGGDPGGEAFFNNIQAAETRQWYLVEWSPAINGALGFNTVHHRRDEFKDTDKNEIQISQYSNFMPNRSYYSHSQMMMRNFCGTIRLVQRLVHEPADW